MVIYLDTETTGLYPGQICQLSYIMQGKEVLAKNFFFSVDYVEYGAYQTHGFSVERLEKLSNGKGFNNFADEIENDFLSCQCIITHNTSFDFMFLRREFERVGKIFYYENSFCSMKESVGLCKLSRSNGGYKYPRLNELCDSLGISGKQVDECTKKLFNTQVDFHDARKDAIAVFLAINKGIDFGYYQKVKPFLEK